jgi:Mg2+-importing ATPase
MMAIHLLIQNLLYDVSQISIPWDRMDEEWLRQPRQWSPRGLTRFMMLLGPVSSLFDLTTFLGLWFVFGANDVKHESLFWSGWFVEGLLTQTLIVHMIRTEKIPFFQSMAAPPVLLLTGAVMLLGCLIPFSPLGAAVGLVPLPSTYWPFVAATLLGYCLLTQFAKRLFIRRFGEWL